MKFHVWFIGLVDLSYGACAFSTLMLWFKRPEVHPTCKKSCSFCLQRCS